MTPKTPPILPTSWPMHPDPLVAAHLLGQRLVDRPRVAELGASVAVLAALTPRRPCGDDVGVGPPGGHRQHLLERRLDLGPRLLVEPVGRRPRHVLAAGSSAGRAAPRGRRRRGPRGRPVGRPRSGRGRAASSPRSASAPRRRGRARRPPRSPRGRRARPGRRRPPRARRRRRRGRRCSRSGSARRSGTEIAQPLFSQIQTSGSFQTDAGQRRLVEGAAGGGAVAEEDRHDPVGAEHLGRDRRPRRRARSWSRRVPPWPSTPTLGVDEVDGAAALAADAAAGAAEEVGRAGSPATCPWPARSRGRGGRRRGSRRSRRAATAPAWMPSWPSPGCQKPPKPCSLDVAVEQQLEGADPRPCGRGWWPAPRRWRPAGVALPWHSLIRIG